jgi:hypothetical protein
MNGLGWFTSWILLPGAMTGAGFALKGGRYWADRLATWLAFATGAALLVLAFVTAVR